MNPAPPPSTKALLCSLIILIVFLWGWGHFVPPAHVTVASLTAPDPSPTPEPRLTAQVTRDQLGISIFNRDAYAWRNVSYHLNARGLFDSGYEMHSDSQRARAWTLIPYVEFAKSDALPRGHRLTRKRTVTIGDLVGERLMVMK